MCKSSGLGSSPVAWHGIHHFTVSSAILLIPGNQTFSCNRLLVLTIPWWPSCARLTVGCCKFFGKTSQSSTSKNNIVEARQFSMYVAEWVQVWVISRIISVTLLNAFDDFLHEGVDTRFLIEFLDRHGFVYSMPYRKVYVLINLGCGNLALAYRVSAHPVSRIFTTRLIPNCEMICLQTQHPFLNTLWQFQARIVSNGVEWLVVSNDDKFAAIKVQMKMVECPDNCQVFSVDLWVFLLCS